MDKNKTSVSPNDAKARYWRTNLWLIGGLLSVWAIVSCFCGIVFIEQLNTFSIGNLPLGFWIANQGSMIVFVLLILIYAISMDFVDRRYQREISSGVDVDN